jgi:GT2 family glycosyltransferase
MTPNVCAIVSAYFCESYLEGRLENLALQDIPKEIVVVCQEKSREHAIALKAGNECADIRIITTADIPTVYGAWNLALRSTEAEYLTSANSDDRHYPGALRKLVEALDRNPKIAIAYSNVDMVRNVDGPPDGKFEFMKGGMKELFWLGCFLGPMPMWRRSLHETYGEFDPSFTVAGDYEFWMRIASKGEKFYKVDDVLGSHLERPDALEHKSPVKTTWEIARAKFAYRDIMENQKPPRKIKRSKSNAKNQNVED